MHALFYDGGAIYNFFFFAVVKTFFSRFFLDNKKFPSN